MLSGLVKTWVPVGVDDTVLTWLVKACVPGVVEVGVLAGVLVSVDAGRVVEALCTTEVKSLAVVVL